jgi:glucose-1-phosphate thymidylyltransferase
MWPLTRDFPKPLLPVGERPAIDYIIDKLTGINVEKIFLSTNMKFQGHFEAWLANNGLSNIEIEAEKSDSEESKLGATRALAELTKKLPDDDYVIVAGNNLFADSLGAMVTFYNRVKRSVVAVFADENSGQVREGSEISLDQESRIVSFKEKPAHPNSQLIGACIYILPFPTLQRTEEYLSQGGKSDEPGNFIAWLFRRETVYGFRLRGRVWDIGSIEEYEMTQREFPRNLLRLSDSK